MGKKLEGNGLFDSSRMMLPEHAAEIRRHRDARNYRVKPELDEQQLELISRALMESYVNKKDIRLFLFDRVEDREVIGVVTRIDNQLKRVRLQTNEDWDWIDLDDVVRVEG